MGTADGVISSIARAVADATFLWLRPSGDEWLEDDIIKILCCNKYAPLSPISRLPHWIDSDQVGLGLICATDRPP